MIFLKTYEFYPYNYIMGESPQKCSRAEEKIASRKQDEELIAEGKMTIEEVSKKNSMFSDEFVQELVKKELRNIFFNR